MKHTLPILLLATCTCLAQSAREQVNKILNDGGLVKLTEITEGWSHTKNPEDEIIHQNGTFTIRKGSDAKGTTVAVFPGVALKQDVDYIVSALIKGTSNTLYGVYAENLCDNRWQNAGPTSNPVPTAWTPIIFNINFKNTTTPSYFALMLRPKGELQVKSLQVSKFDSSKNQDNAIDTDFSTGASRWLLMDNAKIGIHPSEPGNNALELWSTEGRETTNAFSHPFKAKTSTKYKLTFTVRGLEGKGDSTLAHAFKVVPLDGKGSPFSDTNVWIDCMSAKQVKYVTFETMGVATNVHFGISVRHPAHIYIDDLKLEEIVAKPIPAAIVLDAPFNLRDGMFESLPYPAITGKIDINDKTVERIELDYKDAKDNTLWKQAYPTSSPIRFSLKPPSPGEAFPLSLRALDDNGAVVHQETKAIKTYPKAKNELIFTKDGYAVRNGKRIFPIGHWETTRRSSLDVELAFFKEAGFNNLLLPGGEQSLDLAQKYGMDVIIFTTDRISGKTPEEKAQRRKQLGEYYASFSQHPAFLAYFGPDEPMWRGLDHNTYKEVRDLIAEIDPYHPYWVNEAPRGLLKDRIIHATAADVYGLDIYPVPEGGGHSDLEDKGLTAVGKYTDICREATHFAKPVWMILQSFAWEQCGKPDVPPEKATYPTWEQSRFMMYNAIVHGATGMQYHYLGYANKISDQFWSDLRKVTLEISYLEDVITSDSVNPKTVAFDNPNIAFLQKKTNGTMYYLVTNEATEPVATTLSGLTEKSLNALFGAQPIPVVGGKVTLELPARGVLVLSSAEFQSQNTIYKWDTYVPYSKIPPPNPKLNLLKQANWIWFPNEYKIPSSKCHLKKTFTLDKLPSKAIAYYYADDIIEDFEINGTPIERKHPKDRGSSDIVKLLKIGENTIDVKAADGGTPPCAFLTHIKLTFPDGTQAFVNSDASWQASKNGLAPWQPAQAIAPYGAPPWGGVSSLATMVLMEE